MNEDKSTPAGTIERPEGNVGRVGLFGEFNGTGIGNDLTLEWDSSDPELHVHTGNEASPTVPESDEDDRYRHFREAGLPDA